MVGLSDFKVSSKMLAIDGLLERSYFSLIVDCATTVGILTNDPHFRKTVSLELNCHFLKSVKVGEVISVVSITDLFDSDFAHSRCEIYGRHGDILAHGTHLKNFTADKVKFE